MPNIEKEAVKMMANEIVEAIKGLVESNNRGYVQSSFKNYKVSSDNMSASVQNSIATIARNTVHSTPIQASQVAGLQDYVDTAVSQIQIDAAQITNLEATVADIALAEIQVAEIDTAQIRNLNATVASIADAEIQSATIGVAQIDGLNATVATIADAEIASADIGFGQVKDLVAGTAIIREGVGGKLYIDRLSVSDAQIASLTTGELIIQGNNGKLYTIYVDNQGVVQTELRSIEGGDIASNTITGGNLVQNTITARELNVSSIFADSALIGAIKAANIDVADLFANNAFINTLTTTLIQSDIGDDLDISGNSSILLTNQRLALVVSNESTSSQLVLTPQMLQAIADKVNLMADTIDLSANTSITQAVETATTSLTTRISAAESSITQQATDIDGLEGRMDTAESKLTPQAMETTIANSTAVSNVTQTANKITWLIDSDSTASAIVMTDEAMAAISDQIVITANKIQAIANDIDLSANNSVEVAISSALDDGDFVTHPEFNRVVRVDSVGLHVGDNVSSSEVLIDSSTVNVVINNTRYSKFGANYVQFGNYQMRLTADGGIAFKLEG